MFFRHGSAGVIRLAREMKPALMFAAVLLLGSALAMPAAVAEPPPWAQKGGRRDPERAPRAEGISLDEAVNRAERKYHARVIRAETHESNGRRVHQLQLLSDDGRVWTVRIDAASGAEL